MTNILFAGLAIAGYGCVLWVVIDLIVFLSEHDND